MFDATKLREIRKFHDRLSTFYAGTKDARAERHAQWVKELDAALAEIQRKQPKEKKAPANAPSLAEALAYGTEIGMPVSEIRSWFDHFNSNGWLVSGITPMKDWKSAIRNGYRMYCKRKGMPCKMDQQNGHETVIDRSGEPPGWAQFALEYEAGKYATKEFKYARSFMKEDFYRWKKNQLPKR